MQRFMNFVKRIREFDYRNMTPLQIVAAIAGVIVAIWLIVQIINLALTLAPLAIAGGALYFLYRWLSSRSEDIPAEASKSRKERAVEEALENVAAAKATQAGEIVESEVVVERVVESTDESESEEEIPMPETTQNENLGVQQIINPDTGFKEPDISRLIEQEEEKLKEADRVNDEVLAQIEARRRKLRGQQNDE